MGLTSTREKDQMQPITIGTMNCDNIVRTIRPNGDGHKEKDALSNTPIANTTNATTKQMTNYWNEQSQEPHNETS